MLVFGVIEAPRWGWGSASTAAVIVGGVAVLAIMAVAETRSAHAMIDVSLFRNPRFTAACGAVAMALFALLGFIFLMTQYFQVVKSYSLPRLAFTEQARAAGWAIVPGYRTVDPRSQRMAPAGGEERRR